MNRIGNTDVAGLALNIVGIQWLMGPPREGEEWCRDRRLSLAD